MTEPRKPYPTRKLAYVVPNHFCARVVSNEDDVVEQAADYMVTEMYFGDPAVDKNPRILCCVHSCN